MAEYFDAAISGASLHNRPGLLDLLTAAQAQQFDAVLTESIDRLSRDLEDIAGLHKRLAYWGVKIVTLADGEVGKLHVGLKGIIASIYLDDLAQKTRRGQVGRVRTGRIPGGRSYGYDVVAAGEDRGQRTINQAEAEIIRRIFREYVDGSSALEIAGRLNRERIAAPRGREWNASTINGSRRRLNDVINNRLYIGKIVYNRHTHAGAVAPKHLQAYLDEYAFRHNRRRTNGVARIAARVIERLVARPRLTMRTLIDDTRPCRWLPQPELTA